MVRRTACFRELHSNGHILRLPNAWDVASAKLFESLGATAIATTSAGAAWALGYADGNKLPAGLAIALAANLGRILNVPLTIDIESGYSDDPAKVAELAMQLVDVGVAGINIEDGGGPVELLERKLWAIKDALAQYGSDLFVNARTDVFLAQLVPPSEMLNEALTRAKKYAAAGADGIFVPALAQREHIEKVVAGIELPVNLLAWRGLPDAATLERLGVKRLSAGSGIALVAWDHAERAAREFLETGQSERLTGRLPYAQMQGLFD
jgi:2-methylisocitrate lyase-like PEP mutase family enzyme